MEEDLRNQSITLCALLILIFVSAFSHAAAQTVHKKTMKTAPGNDQEIIHEIQELEQSLRTAFLDGKTAWWERHLDDHYTGLNADGRTLDKASVIQLYGSPDLKYTEVYVSDMNARIYGGDCVISSGTSSVKGVYKGQDFSGDYYFVHVWIKEGQEWRLANAQATKLAQTSQ